jgi:hypothetical protein
MQLSSVVGGIINKRISKISTTILYEPKHSLLDQIMFLTGFEFLIFGDSKYSFVTDNVINIPNHLRDLYTYSLYISYGIEHFASNNTSIDSVLHIPSIVLVDNIKVLKKEDLYLLSNRLKNNHKCFLRNNLLSKLANTNKSVEHNIGIPSSIFYITKEYDTRNNVVILGKNMLSDQIASFLNSKQIDCDIIDLYDNISNINLKFNNYKFCIDLTENYLENLLCATLSGCRGITLSKNDIILDDIKHLDNLDEIYSYITETNNIKPDTKTALTKIENRFPFDSFITFIKEYIELINKEVYIK